LWCGRLACTENVQTQAAGYIASLPMFIENAHRSRFDSFTVYGLPEMMDALQRHLFTDVIWPDFVKIAMGGKPLVRLQPIKPKPFRWQD
jgi:cAMP phosphodiesterase